MTWHLPLSVLALSTAVLAGCVPVEQPPIDPGLPPADACGAPGLQGLVGQDRRVLASMTFPSPTRVIEPGMAVTMDYNPTRLNIELDAGGRIIRVTCG